MGFLTGLVLVAAAALGGLYVIGRTASAVSSSRFGKRTAELREDYGSLFDWPPPIYALALTALCLAAVGVAFLLGF